MTSVLFRSRPLIGSLVASCLILGACSSDPELTADLTTTTAAPQPETSETTEVSAIEATGTTEAAAAREPDDTVASDETSTVCGAAFLVVFDEGAPRDRMTISNVSEVAVDLKTISIDLTTSAGQIIFDTSDGGDGVEVFQEFQVEAGDAVLAADPVAVDGGSTLDLLFASFGPGESFTFSIDVDDQLEDSDLGQIQVTGAEIEGALISVELMAGSKLTAAFATDSTASGNASC